jgi:hypothetical protein
MTDHHGLFRGARASGRAAMLAQGWRLGAVHRLVAIAAWRSRRSVRFAVRVFLVHFPLTVTITR